MEELSCDPLSKSVLSTLHVAAAAGSLSIVQYLIETKKCNPMVGHHKITALHVSAENGHLNLLKYFIEKIRMNKNLADYNGKTPLTYAACKGHLPCVKYLLKMGCNYYDENQLTPLHHASTKGHLDVVKYLMDHHSNMYSLNPWPGMSPLFMATMSGELNVVKYFTKDKKCDPYITVEGDLLTSLLHLAAQQGHTELVRYFVEDVKLDHMMLDIQKACPPHLAAGCGHIDIVQYLLSLKEMDPFLPDRATPRNTAIHHAAACDKLEVVKFYVKTFGSKSLQIRNLFDQTPLDVALRRNSHLTALYLTVKTFVLL